MPDNQNNKTMKYTIFLLPVLFLVSCKHNNKAYGEKSTLETTTGTGMREIFGVHQKVYLEKGRYVLHTYANTNECQRDMNGTYIVGDNCYGKVEPYPYSSYLYGSFDFIKKQIPIEYLRADSALKEYKEKEALINRMLDSVKILQQYGSISVKE